MKSVIVVTALGACGRPVERTAPPPVPVPAVVANADAAIDAGSPVPSDGKSPAVAGDAGLVTTVVQTEIAGGTITLMLAAGKDQGVEKSWRVTFIVDGARPPPACIIMRVGPHETVCKLEGTQLPSRVVRLEP